MSNLELDYEESEQDGAEDPVDACPECGGHDAVMLGELGEAVWVRCRDCGADFTI